LVVLERISYRLWFSLAVATLVVGILKLMYYLTNLSH